MLRRLGIRAKVLAVLAVPMLVILAAGVYISSTALTQLRLDKATRGVVDLVQAYQPLNQAFQNERVVSSTGASADQVKLARAATDKALADVRPVSAKLDLAEFPTDVVGKFTELQRSFDVDLAAMRQNVDTQARPEIIQNAYASLASRQIALVDLVAQTISDRDVAKYLSAQASVASVADDLVKEAVTGLTLMNRSAVSSASAVQFTNLATQTEAQRSAARDQVASLGVKSLEIGYNDPTADYMTMRSTIGIGTNAAFALVDPTAFAKGVTSQTATLSKLSTEILTAGHSAATKAIDSQTQRAFITIGIAVGALVLSFVFAIVVSRTIVVPLRRLTAAAADVRDELPHLVEQVQVPGEGPSLELPQIPVTSSDEVGRLAAAFNAVNATTVQVAQEQAALRGSIAEMFVNVARRDQVLLNRQLSFIDSLERSEEDPSTLANLFRLDHLATRMRRNAESLLVLAGIDSGRRLRDSLPLSDVIRTASSEIEQYDRVDLELTADPAMLGFNALPAAHLLAELLENATVFSEPETPIVVATGVRGDQVEVRIIDQGLGMSDAELTSANEKIRSVGAGDALGAQRLGLFVVGRLAQRLGAEVELRKSSRGTTGTETVVRFPATLFQSTEVSALGTYGSAPVSAPTPVVEEAPEAQPVDLAALTDGQTPLGLPRRRAGVDPAGAEATPAAPLAPAASVAEPGRAGGLPQRSRKTFDEDAIVLPEAPTPTLSPSLSTDASSWSPALVDQQGASGLPSRTRAATSAWAGEQGAAATAGAAGAAGAADPAARTGLFSGFRGRGDLGGVARPVDPVPSAFRRAADGGAAPAAAAFFQSRSAESAPAEPEAPAPEPMAIPQLVPDDDDLYPSDLAAYAGGPAQEPAEAFEEAAPVAPQLPVWASTPELEQRAAELTPEPVAEAAVPAWAAPAIDLSQWSTPAEEVPAFEPEPAAFTSYSGFAGWSGSPVETVAQPAAPDETDAYRPFGRSAQEAQAWTTGTIPVVPEPAGFPAAAVPAAQPAAWAPEPEAVDAEQQADEEGASETSWQTPAWQPPTWSTPWSEQGPAVPAPAAEAVLPVVGLEPDPEPEPLAVARALPEPVGADVPAQPAFAGWSAPADLDDPAATQLFSPVEAADAVGAEPSFGGPVPTGAPFGDAATVAEQTPFGAVATVEAAPIDWQQQAAWAPTNVAPPAPARSRERAPRRRGLFGRRRPAPQTGQAPVAAPAAPPAPTAPVRNTAWGPDIAANVPGPAQHGAPVGGFTPAPHVEPPAFAAPAPAPVSAPTSVPAASSPAPQPPAPPAPLMPAVVDTRQTSWSAAPEPASNSWAPSGWAPRPDAGGAVPEPTAAPTVRIGALDDDIAAMLAMRSDIQEQALSELSQLSAYRPQVVSGAPERLTKRVPTAIPEAPAIDSAAAPAERDPAQLRSRLSSFQSGTARGRRDAGQDGAR